jgi:flagellar basal body-associated protein FliL
MKLWKWILLIIVILILLAANTPLWAWFIIGFLIAKFMRDEDDEKAES